MSSRASEDDLSFGLHWQRTVAELFRSVQYPLGQLNEMPEKAQLDYEVVTAGKVTAYLEVKARRCLSTQYSTAMVSRNKWEAAGLLKRIFCVPVYAVVRYTDRTGFFLLTEPYDGTAFVGRRDRNNEGTEHVFFKHERFTWLS